MIDTLVYPYGDAKIKGRIKLHAGDFRVDEDLGFEPAGEGEHLLMQIEKTGLSTHELIDRIAAEYQLPPRDIGYCGLKDKQAITSQWLSIRLPGQLRQIDTPCSTDFTVLRQGWHRRKLKPGTHRRNHFDVTIRNVSALPSAALHQINLLRTKGMANYFGRQRFGRQLDNVRQALKVFGNSRKTRKLSRTKKGLYLSALRSHLFNQILSRRIESGYWNQPVEGDAFMLAGSQSIFCESIDAELISRFARQDISSTVSLYGSGRQLLQGVALALECQVLAEFETIKATLLQQNTRLAMRATRVVIENLESRYNADDQTLRIRATLPRGCYFTTLLDHFVNTETG